MYEDWTKEELIRRIKQLEWNKNDLEKQVIQQYKEINGLNLRIKQELEPRIRAEASAYDRWIADPSNKI